MDSSKKTARIAGLVYLVVVVTGIFHLMYVPTTLVVRGNPTLTVSNIMANETLFRLGIVGGILCYTAFLILPLVLYKLLSPVNKTHAVLMVALSVVSVPISFVNMLNKLAILTLISKSSYLGGMDPGELQTQILLYLDYARNGNQLAMVFWALWLFPFGYLVYKSGFIPKIFGILLMAGCFGDLIDFFGHFLFPTYAQTLISSYVGIPASLGEIGICLWLLIIGTWNKRKQTTSISTTVFTQ